MLNTFLPPPNFEHKIHKIIILQISPDRYKLTPLALACKFPPAHSKFAPSSLLYLHWRLRSHRENLKTEVSFWKRKCVRSWYAEEIWIRNNHRSFWICVWRKLGQGNQMVIARHLSPKTTFLKMFSVQTKTQSRLFKIPPVCLTIQLNKDFSGVVWTRLFTALYFLVFLFDCWTRGYNRERTGRQLKTEDLTANPPPPRPTPACFALALLASSFVCVNYREVVNSLSVNGIQSPIKHNCRRVLNNLLIILYQEPWLLTVSMFCLSATGSN